MESNPDPTEEKDKMNDKNDEEDEECRVCRTGPTIDRQLFAPCLCSGSIGLVHQDCLEQWLNHSRKDKCELCNSKYEFMPLYAEDAPAEVPLRIFLTTISKRLLFVYVPFLLKIACAFLLWLIVMPLCTSWMFRFWMRRNVLSIGILKERLLSWQHIRVDIVGGLILALVIALSFIVLMSFADFLRVHWNNGFGQEPPVEIPLQRNPDANGNVNVNANAAQLNRPHLRLGRHQPLLQPRQQGRPPLAPIPPPQQRDIQRRDFLPVPNQMRQRINNDRQQRIIEAGGGNNVNNPPPLIHEDVSKGSINPSEQLLGNQETNRDNYGESSNNEEIKNNSSKLDETLKLKLCKDNDISNDDINNHKNEDNFEKDIKLSGFERENKPQEQFGYGFNENVDLDNDEWEDDSEDSIESGGNGDFQNEDEQDDDNDVDDNDNDNEDDLFGNVQGGDIEIHLALDDLLGIGRDHGNLDMVRNVVWLIIFNGLYIGLFAAIPSKLGLIVLKLLIRFDWISKLLSHPTLNNMKETFHNINTISAENGDSLQFHDICIISLGYCSVFLIIFSLQITTSSLNYVLQKIRHQRYQLATYIIELVNGLSSIVKVGILLFVRIFLLPVCLGTIVLWSFNVFFQFTMNEWSLFISHNFIGSISLAWVIGISYMLTVTLSVLQLREILHPDILAQAIRPQEPHLDLLSSLLNESSATHIRRICASMIVYLILLILFILIPMLFSRFLIGNEKILRLKLWYIVPDLQLPLELAIAHIIFLTVLDKKKNIIGRILHSWLVFASKKLGITKFILPLPMKRNENKIVNNNSDEDNILRDQNGNPLVGRPLRRPPPGWDARMPRNTTRWAWGKEETKSDIELNVAPRITPSYWLLRTACLLIMSWILVVAFVLFLFFIPLNIGTVLLDLIQCPEWLRHDPIIFVIGSILCGILLNLIQNCKWKFGQQWIDATGKTPLKIVYKFIKAITLWIICELFIGLMIQFMITPLSFWYENADQLTLNILSSSEITASSSSPALNDISVNKFHLRIDEMLSLWFQSPSVWGSAYVKGSILLCCCVLFVISETVERFTNNLGVERPAGLREWVTSIRINVWNPPIRIFENNNNNNNNNDDVWEIEDNRLKTLMDKLVWPLFHECLMNTLSIVPFAILMFYSLHFTPFFEFSYAHLVCLYFLKLDATLIIAWNLSRLMQPQMELIYMNLRRAVRDENYLIGKTLIGKSRRK